MRVITRTADQVRDLRRALSLTQKEFAARLQVSRRTIIRGEQRGIEIPWYSTSDLRVGLYKLWGDLEVLAADRARAGDRQSVTPGRHNVRGYRARFAPAGGDTHGAPGARKVSPATSGRGSGRKRAPLPRARKRGAGT